jgi:hypothetical protein
VLTRVREPGVVHLFEIVRLQGEFVVNAGVIFVSLGPGISLADRFSDFEFVGEGTLSVTPFGPHVSLGHLRRDGAGYTYGEVAAWFVFTVGAGAGRGRTTPLRATSSSDCPSRWPASASGRFLRPHPGGQLELMLKVSMGLTSGWH